MTVLVIDDEPEIADLLSEYLTSCGQIVYQAHTWDGAEELLKVHNPSLVFSDVHVPGKNGLQFLEMLNAKGYKIPTWIFVSADASPELVHKASSLGCLDVMQKPFTLNDIRMLLNRVDKRRDNPMREVVDMVESISGLHLGDDKRLLVETRLMRRARAFRMNSVEEYIDYFKKHRKTEVSAVVSLLTTHTTEFFREPDHFDFLVDKVLPSLPKNRPWRFWSAACSTGEEVWSLAMALLEDSAQRKYTPPKIEVLGTDLDVESLQVAQEGIYSIREIEKISPALQKKYFDRGTGEISHLFKVKDNIHKLCRFEQNNLLAKSYQFGKFDVIFLRNVLIYFKPDDVYEIIKRMENCLTPEGVLFLGHSESVAHGKTSFKSIGNSVYRVATADSIKKENAAPLMRKNRKRIFIIDDSPTFRKVLSSILSVDAGFEVVGEASNPLDAEKLMDYSKIDAITLDLEMPVMDGISWLEKVQNQSHPPVVMISTTQYDDAVEALHCFEVGAVDYIQKPMVGTQEVDAERIRSVVAAACDSHRRKTGGRTLNASGNQLQWTPKDKQFIAIGASTGGVEAIKDVLLQFPEVSPPVFLVQHIPAGFSGAFAKRLNEICKISVVEAKDGMIAEQGTAYIAPGNFQMTVQENASGKLRITVSEDKAKTIFKPSVDILFDSLTPLVGKFQVAAALLTGMGSDGAKGLLKLRQAGGFTVAQNEETCVVFGMPKAAIEMGAAIETQPLDRIAGKLFRALQSGHSDPLRKSA